MKKLLLLPLMTACALSGCSSKSTDKTSNSEESYANDSTLIVYYSLTGTTEKLAKELQGKLNCKIVEIEASNPYNTDYDATIERWKTELADNAKVEIKPIEIDFSQYKRIFLGFPIWGGTYASPVKTFLEENKLDGMNIVTFATYGSGGIENATADVARVQPGANVTEGIGIREARISKAGQEAERYLIENGFIDGNIEPLPEFGERRKVSETETEIFNKACGDYKFPLGIPENVAVRTIPTGTEYMYDVKSETPSGEPARSTVYVTVEQDGTTEFTRVVRH